MPLTVFLDSCLSHGIAELEHTSELVIERDEPLGQGLAGFFVITPITCGCCLRCFRRRAGAQLRKEYKHHKSYQPIRMKFTVQGRRYTEFHAGSRKKSP